MMGLGQFGDSVSATNRCGD